jgi:hypothetical protein
MRTGGITTKAVAEAVRTVSRLSLEQKEELVGRIHEAQPHILYAVLALSLDGVPEDMLEHALHLLMVVHFSVVSQCPEGLPQASLDDIRRAMERHLAMLGYLSKEPDQKMWRLTCESYPEPVLLAYVVNYLLERGIWAETDAQYRVSSMAKVALDLYVDAYRGRPGRKAGG